MLEQCVRREAGQRTLRPRLFPLQVESLFASTFALASASGLVMAHVVEINDLESLAGYRLLWNSFLQHTPGASFFHTLDWLETYWRHFGAGQRLRVLVAYAAGEPLGILPLVVRKEPLRLGGVRVLTYPLHDWGSFYGPIGPNPTATLLAGLSHLRRTPADWDLLDLRWVDAAHDRGRTARALDIKGISATTAVWAQSAQIEIAGTWDQYLAGRKRKFRENIRAAERRLAERGRVEYLRWRPQGAARGDADPRWDLYDACEQLAARSWQGDSTTGTTLSHDPVRPFLRDAHQAAARAGAAEVNLLLVDDAPVAYAYGYQYDGRVFGLRTGYDAERVHQGAGTVLFARKICDSFERGDRLLDFGAEYLECKRHWVTRLATSYHYTHYRGRALRGQALRFKRWLAGVRHPRQVQK
jgi:CelD/BcsL family acetyltransferase involved in cellulose biosynthesis